MKKLHRMYQTAAAFILLICMMACISPLHAEIITHDVTYKGRVWFNKGCIMDIRGTWRIGGTTVNATAAQLNQLYSGALEADTVSESTSGAGVTVDGVKMKDNDIVHAGTVGTALWAGSYIAAEPQDYYEFMDDFFTAGYIANAADTNTAGLTILKGGKFSEAADHAGWLVSVTDGDSDEGETIVVADDAAGGILVITCNDKADDAVQAQMNGESFAVTTTKDLWFEARIAIEDVSEDTAFVGLTVADTDILGSLGNDFMGFYMDQSAVLQYQQAKNGTITTNTVTTNLLDATFVRVGVYADGSVSNSYVYLNGTCIATNAASATLPNDEALSPALAILTTDTGADYLKADYMKIQATR